MSSSNKPKNPSEDIKNAPPHCVGPEKSTLSSMLQEPGKFIRLARNENITPEDYYIVGHRLLYEFLLKLDEEGEEIELVSLVQRLLDKGLLDRIGGPSVVTDLYSYAPSNLHFSTHISQVKDKAVLREVIKRANAQIRAAYESPDEVKELVEQCAADAEQIRVKTENRSSDFKRYREQIVTAESMKEDVAAYLNGDTVMGGDPFFLPDFAFACRKHETTVFLGTSFHGKSNCVQNQVAYLATLGRKSMVASFEQAPAITMGQILAAMTAYPDIAKSEEYDPAWNYITSVVSMYKGQKKASAKHLVQTFRQAYLSEGIDTFVIDNLMTMQVDRGDNSAIADACDLLRVFVSEYPVHLHLVCHPRKPANDAKANPNKPPTQADILGASEIGNMCHNLVVVWRDMDKNRKLEEMKASGSSDLDQLAFWQSTPCGRINLEKQKLNGKMPTKSTWFSQETNQFMISPGKPKPMFTGNPPWES